MIHPEPLKGEARGRSGEVVFSDAIFMHGALAIPANRGGKLLAQSLVEVLGEDEGTLAVGDEIEVVHVGLVGIFSVQHFLRNLVSVVEHGAGVVEGVDEGEDIGAVDLGDFEVEDLVLAEGGLGGPDQLSHLIVDIRTHPRRRAGVIVDVIVGRNEPVRPRRRQGLLVVDGDIPFGRLEIGSLKSDQYVGGGRVATTGSD